MTRTAARRWRNLATLLMAAVAADAFRPNGADSAFFTELSTGGESVRGYILKLKLLELNCMSISGKN